MHVVFEILNGKMLSLTWSKKNNSYRANGSPPKPKPKPTPSRPDGGGGARVGSSLFL